MSVHRLLGLLCTKIPNVRQVMCTVLLLIVSHLLHIKWHRVIVSDCCPTVHHSAPSAIPFNRFQYFFFVLSCGVARAKDARMTTKNNDFFWWRSIGSMMTWWLSRTVAHSQIHGTVQSHRARTHCTVNMAFSDDSNHIESGLVLHTPIRISNCWIHFCVCEFGRIVCALKFHRIGRVQRTESYFSILLKQWQTYKLSTTMASPWFYFLLFCEFTEFSATSSAAVSTHCLHCILLLRNANPIRTQFLIQRFTLDSWNAFDIQQKKKNKIEFSSALQVQSLEWWIWGIANPTKRSALDVAQFHCAAVSRRVYRIGAITVASSRSLVAKPRRMRLPSAPCARTSFE